MMQVPDALVEIGEYFGEGFRPVMAFEGWRVAMKRYADSVRPENVRRVDRHNETNEVFILTEGKADLIAMDDDGNGPSGLHVTPMRLNVAYNVRQGVWHHVVMEPGSHILVFEREDTGRHNSDSAELSPEVIAEIQSRLSVGKGGPG
jgi:ureidoglycolate hydrolase